MQLLYIINNDFMFQKFRLKINRITTGDVGKFNQETREAWLENVLSEIPKNYKILDAGAGESRYKKFCNHLDYTSQDFAEYDGVGDGSGIQKNSRNYNELDIISDISEIPVPDKHFDAIMCIEVIEHLPNPLDAIKEFRRILKKDGTLIITAPFASLTHYAPYHFSTGFNKYFYEHHLNDLDFQIEEITPNGNYFEFIAQEIRRLNGVSKKYANKTLNIFYRANLNITLHLLNIMTKRNLGSEELLNFGFNVVAKKIK